MPAITVRNLTDETHRALKHRAKLNGTSAEAEVRAILQETLFPKDRIKLGTELAHFGKKFGGIELEIVRDPSPIEPADFD